MKQKHKTGLLQKVMVYNPLTQERIGTGYIIHIDSISPNDVTLIDNTGIGLPSGDYALVFADECQLVILNNGVH